MARKLTILFLSLLASASFAQQKHWTISFEAGIGAGWWVYDKGLTDTLPQEHRGYDRTHLSFLIPQSVSVSYQNEKFLFGLQAGRTKLEDQRMVSSDHRRGRFNKYSISAEGYDHVPLLHLAAQLGPNLIYNPKFRLTPVLLLGGLWLKVDHPEVTSFDRRLYRAGELQFAIQMTPHTEWLLFPRYTNIRLSESQSPYQQSHHNVYGIGLHTALAIRF